MTNNLRHKSPEQWRLPQSNSGSRAKTDRALWVVQRPGREPLRVRLGSGREPVSNDGSVRSEHLSGMNLNVRSNTNVPVFNVVGKRRITGNKTHRNCYSGGTHSISRQKEEKALANFCSMHSRVSLSGQLREAHMHGTTLSLHHPQYSDMMVCNSGGF